MFRVVIILNTLLALQVSAQTITVNKQQFASKAHAAYYSLPVHGLESFTCRVQPDWSSLPDPMLQAMKQFHVEHMPEVDWRVKVPARGVITFTHSYPEDIPASIIPYYDRTLDLYTQFINGFFMTWRAKAMDGPLPWSLGGWEVQQTSNGYDVHIDHPAVTLTTTKTYRVTKISTVFPEETLVETPVFSESPDGFLLSSDDAVSTTKDEVTNFHLDMTYQKVDGLLLLEFVHLKVNQNVDIRFHFTDCTADKGIALKAGPPQ